uniref:Transmembrane protein 17 n=1 Tax=Graphocephala atropunctata TaxID=36148 RepID=A0A1B6M7Q6_9HEMI
MLKQTVSTVSEHIFPGIGYSFSNNSSLPQCKERNEAVSNFPLQMALFFNVAFFPVWLTTIIVMLPLKFEKLPDLNKIILIIALTAAVLIEMTRLYMGYLGNLTGNIPGLAGFWMLSLLLQSPLQLLMLLPALRPGVVELVSQSVMCCLLAVQLFSGFLALSDLARYSSARFHVSQFLAEK